MSESHTAWLECLIVEEQVEFTLLDLCRVTGAPEDQLTLWIEQGVLEPLDDTQSIELRFDGSSLRRARTAWRLVQDLEINAAGIALVLDLLKEIAVLRAQQTGHHQR